MQSNHSLIAAGSAMILGAFLHIAIIFGGPDGYIWLGAPAGLVDMVRSGSLRPAISCALIGAVLFVCAAYAYSAAGLIRKLPGLRVVLGLIGGGLIVRGISFVPIVMWRPYWIAGLCGKCQEGNTFVLVTSAICLLVGIGYVTGALRAHS
jgi:putative oxidoreductase